MTHPTPAPTPHRHKRRWQPIAAGIVAVVGIITLATGCNDSTDDQQSAGTVTRAEIEAAGEQWPFAVDSAVLACDGEAVTVQVDGATYALNGLAISRDLAPELGNDDPVWLDAPDAVAAAEDNPDLEVWKIGVGGLIRRGLDLC